MLGSWQGLEVQLSRRMGRGLCFMCCGMDRTLRLGGPCMFLVLTCPGVQLSLISGSHSYLCILWVLSEFSDYTNLCQSTVYASTK